MHHALLSAVLIGMSAALAAAPAVSSESDRELTMTETVTRLTAQDLGRKGLSQGDRLVYLTALRATDGKKLGVGGGECALISGKSAETARYHCTQTYRLADGDIMGTGFLDYAQKENRFAVVGGTGRYEGVTGTLDFTEPTSNSFVLVFTLA